MNLSLIDPFVLAQDYPDTLTEKLSMAYSLAISLANSLTTILYRKRTCDVSTLQPQRRLSGFRTSSFPQSALSSKRTRY